MRSAPFFFAAAWHLGNKRGKGSKGMRFLPAAVSLRGHTTDALPRFDRFFYVRSSSIMADPAYMQALKGEFDQWLQGLHEANDPNLDAVYVNAEGKPVRRWVLRNKEAEDAVGAWD